MIQRILPPAAAVAALTASLGAQVELYRIDGAQPGEELGFSVAVIGDIDGDGADDYVVGAPRSGVGGADAGTAYVVSGLAGGTLKTLHGSAGDFFGYSVAGPGDLDGDMVPDWIVGAPQRWYEPGYFSGGFGAATAGHGYAVAYSGQTGDELYTAGPSFGAVYGLSIGTGGDVDQDTVPDFILGGTSALVYSGTDGTVIREHSYFGEVQSSAIAHDLNGTGKGDYVIGTYADGIGYGLLRAYRSTGAQMWADAAGGNQIEYGFSCAAPGDLDGDGRPDVVGGALEDGGFSVIGRGRVRVLSGVDGGLFYEDRGKPFTARGYALASLGDFNGDGVPEFAASAPGIENDCIADAVYVLSGAAFQVVMKIPYEDICDRFGSGLAAGDVDGDGFVELLIGARLDDDGGVDAGSLKVFDLQTGPTLYCEAQLNSENCTPAIAWTGQPSLTANNFRVRASTVLNQKSGLLFWGLGFQQTPFKGGQKCVAPPTVRTPIQNSGGNPSPPDDCTGTFVYHMNAGYMSSKGLSAGDTVYCQYWSRDPASNSATNLTDGLSFTIEP